MGFSSGIARILSCSFSQIDAIFAELISSFSRLSWLIRTCGGGAGTDFGYACLMLGMLPDFTDFFAALA